MRTRIKDASGLVIVRDAGIAPPPAGPNARDELRASARHGQLFFFESDDPTELTIEIIGVGPVPAELTQRFTPVGGAFLLDLPSGRAVLSGYDVWTTGRGIAATLDVAPGSYVVVAHERRPPDARLYEVDIARLVDPHALAFHRRVTRVAPLGCLPMIGLTLALLLQRWTLAAYAAAVTVLLSAAYSVISRSSRFRAVEEAKRTYNAELPVYVLELRPVERSPSLVGGWLAT